MGLKLQLVKDGKVVFSLPLPAQDESARQSLAEVGEEGIERLTTLYAFSANERRLRMMIELARRREMRFSDMLQIALNPKLVRDFTEPMLKEGIVVHEGKGWGSSYRPSERGVALALTMTSGLNRILELLEDELGSGTDE